MANTFFGTLNNKNRPPFLMIWFGWFMGSILDVICALISIITLCMFRPSWDMKWRFYASKRECKYMIKRKANTPP